MSLTDEQKADIKTMFGNDETNDERFGKIMSIIGDDSSKASEVLTLLATYIEANKDTIVISAGTILSIINGGIKLLPEKKKEESENAGGGQRHTRNAGRRRQRGGGRRSRRWGR